jgi:hypothetical protein
VLGRWRRQFAGGSDLQVRAYFDSTHRNDPSFHDDLDTFDLMRICAIRRSSSDSRRFKSAPASTRTRS